MKLTLALLSSMFLGLASVSAAEAKPTDVPATYPLKKCPVSDEALGEMGKPIKVTHDGTDVYLCCKSCVKDFNKDPGKYAEIVKKASKK